MKLIISALGLAAAANGVVTCDDSTACGGTICWTGGTHDFTAKAAWSSDAFPMATQKAIVQGSGSKATVSTNLRVQALRVGAGSSLRISSGKKLRVSSGCSAFTGTCSNCDATGGVCVQDGLCECNTGYKYFFTKHATNYFDTDPDANCAREDKTANPTHSPTEVPTFAPTEAPTETPTNSPTEVPTEAPTWAPTPVPTTGPITLGLAISKSPESDGYYTDAYYAIYKSTIAATFQDDLDIPAGSTAEDCISITDESGNYLAPRRSRRSGWSLPFVIKGECNTDGSTASDYQKIMIDASRQTSYTDNTGTTRSGNRISTELGLGETRAKMEGAVACPDGTELPTGASCATQDEATAAASLPIIPIAAGGGGFVLIVILFLVCKKKKKKTGSNFSKYTVAGETPPALPPKRGSGRRTSRTSRGNATGRGSRSSRGQMTGRRPPMPPAKRLLTTTKDPKNMKPALFPPLSAPKPLISKKKQGGGAVLGEA